MIGFLKTASNAAHPIRTVHFEIF